jgi:sugar phosphate isomerase/epimerase
MPRIAGFGFSTIGERPDLSDLDRALGRLEDVGATHCELSLCGAHLIAGGRIIPEMRRRLEAACTRRRLAYTTHGVLAVNFMDEANLERHKAVCRATLELTAAVGATAMAHHPGMVAARPGAVIERLHGVERACLAEMGDVAARLGTRLAVETLFVETPAMYTPDPIRLARELAALDHPHVVGTLDVSHTYIMSRLCGIDPEAAVRAFAPVTGHAHLHDSFGRPTTVERFYAAGERIAFGDGDIHLPFGWGDIPFERLLPGLPFKDGTVLIVELPERYWAELPAVAETARRFVELCNAAV